MSISPISGNIASASLYRAGKKLLGPGLVSAVKQYIKSLPVNDKGMRALPYLGRTPENSDAFS